MIQVRKETTCVRLSTYFFLLLRRFHTPKRDARQRRRVGRFFACTNFLNQAISLQIAFHEWQNVLVLFYGFKLIYILLFSENKGGCRKMILNIAFGPDFSSNNLFAKPTRAYI
jgi:hypothetical protein